MNKAAYCTEGYCSNDGMNHEPAEQFCKERRRK